jgi:hypothetical protein
MTDLGDRSWAIEEGWTCLQRLLSVIQWAFIIGGFACTVFSKGSIFRNASDIMKEMQPLPTQTLEIIAEALFAGQRKQAVTMCRQVMASGEAEAKDAVKRIEAELRVSFPDRFRKPRWAAMPAVTDWSLSLSGLVVAILGILVLWESKHGGVDPRGGLNTLFSISLAVLVALEIWVQLRKPRLSVQMLAILVVILVALGWLNLDR